MQQGRALIGGTTIVFKFTPQNPNYYIINKNSKINVKVEFIDANLYLRRLRIVQAVVEAHRETLHTAPIKYPITRVEVNSFNIPSTVTNIMIDNVHYGQLPRRMFITFVKNLSFNGVYDTSPFDFEHFNLDEIKVFIDGIQYPTKAYKPNYDKHNSIREFYGLFEALNQTGTESTIDFDRSTFESKPIYGFNFAPDWSDGYSAIGHVNSIKRGTIRVHLSFKHALNFAVNMITYSEYDNLIQINENNNVMLDYS